MQLKETIRYYRKLKNMTQEEMASALGVSTPAVNKWENGSSCPDISLLAPLSRLLNISLDTLLSFERELSAEEMAKLIKETNHRLHTRPFEEAWSWILKKTHVYPDNDVLLWQLYVLTDSYLASHPELTEDKIEAKMQEWMKRLLSSKDESIRFQAANSLFQYCLRKQDYSQAYDSLKYFSSQNPVRKQKQALLEYKTGKMNESMKNYEELLFQLYQILFSVFTDLKIMSIESQDFSQARIFTDKLADLARIFEMGTFHELSCQIDLAEAEQDTAKIEELLKQMIEHVHTINAFASSSLYRHMPFKQTDENYIDGIRQHLMNFSVNKSA